MNIIRIVLKDIHLYFPFYRIGIPMPCPRMEPTHIRRYFKVLLTINQS